MAVKSKIFRELESEEKSGVEYKSLKLRKGMIAHFASCGDSTIADLCKTFNSSIPTITKALSELIEDGLVVDFGKIETGGGRRPNVYGLDPKSLYFMGVEVKRKSLNLAIIDINKQIVKLAERVPFRLNNSKESLDNLCAAIQDFLSGMGPKREKVLGAGVNITGRVNSKTGNSYSFFYFEEEPLAEMIEKQIGIKTFVENDTRAMTYGEYACGVVKDEKDVLFINMSAGVGLGVVQGGQIQYGKSGFAGEFGHIPFFENDIICHCGKKGCLETEVSGPAIEQMCISEIEKGTSSVLTEKYEKDKTITLDDIIEAANNDDVLAIDVIAQIGEKLGRGIALLINIFNPELVILGGTLATTGDYLILPVKSAVNKYALSLVYDDTKLKISKLGNRAGVIGACLLVRNKMLHLKTL
uniref:ROK family transcriptional regulator n=1 Tax=uncultured Draconibacterium sp. TaxID=1573823 RepID=UPI0032172B14